jgi:excinuclease UvrABC ATPase subunit
METMNATPETTEAWAAVSRTPDGMYDSRIPISAYAYAMADHSRKMERERNEARAERDELRSKYATHHAEAEKLAREYEHVLESQKHIKHLKETCMIKVKALQKQTSKCMLAEHQRDMLAEVLRQIRNDWPEATIVEDGCDCCDCEFLRPIDAALSTLHSQNQNHE